MVGMLHTTGISIASCWLDASDFVQTVLKITITSQDSRWPNLYPIGWAVLYVVLNWFSAMGHH
jgi:hypothetical protein